MTVHNLTEQEWIEYIEGSMDADRQRPVDAHVAICEDCARTASQLRRWREEFRREGARLREAMATPQADIEHMLEVSLERIYAMHPPRGSVYEALMALRSLIEPILGPGTVRSAMNLASRPLAVKPEEIMAPEWGAFVSGMSEATSKVCGLTAGRLVQLAGASLGNTLR
jgi:anti-sigma factor RsiW